ncbi:MAG: phosphotransferase, partial [Gammaproteobacteria bacterium]|nr:phosphotransferase [Gammaproteobacteria bacterium]
MIKGSKEFDEEDDNRGNRIDEAEVTEELQDVGPSDAEHPYQQLSPHAVIEAVESTGRYSDARILTLNSYENRVYQVGIEDEQPVIAKFYRPERWSKQQIDEEHRFTQYLYDADIPVVPPLIITPGSEFPTLSSTGVFIFALYPRQGGRAPQLDDLEHLHQLGRFIGRIHA